MTQEELWFLFPVVAVLICLGGRRGRLEEGKYGRRWGGVGWGLWASGLAWGEGEGDAFVG